MTVSSVWSARLRAIYCGFSQMLWVAILYLTSELVIWGLSSGMSNFNLSFFASIIAMLLVFAIMTLAQILMPGTSLFYRHWIKDKVDFINAQLGVGFSIPIIMLNPNDVLGGTEIARIIGNFGLFAPVKTPTPPCFLDDVSPPLKLPVVLTNIVSWSLVFALSFVGLIGCFHFMSHASCYLSSCNLRRRLASAASSMELAWLSDSSSDENSSEENLSRVKTNDSSSEPSSPDEDEDEDDGDENEDDEVAPESQQQPLHQVETPRWWRYVCTVWPSALALSCIFLIGTPIQAAAHDPRILDACVLWFVWISSVKTQYVFKHSSLCIAHPRTKSAMATLMNPVLATTLLTMAYTRAKAAALPGFDLTDVLGTFSSGIPLWLFWSSAVRHSTLIRDAIFGAGDAAMSILECGLLVWGFKLYECRMQLLSVAGLFTAIVSIAAAAGNVFLSVLAGRLMGLGSPEALAFAARSTTLALAKPAMQVIGGNLVVNAALVVSNGILGQLVYPFALDRTGVQRQPASQSTTAPAPDHQQSESSRDESSAHERHLIEREKPSYQDQCQDDAANDDSPITIAAGIAIGINGAAMGVAYLYETRSRAAPYAALSMTVFGVMTVVFTTVEPFKGALLGLALSHT